MNAEARERIAEILADWESIPWHVMTMEQKMPYYGKAERILNAIDDFQPKQPEHTIPAEVLDHIGTILATHHAFPGSEAYDELEEWYISLGRTPEVK